MFPWLTEVVSAFSLTGTLNKDKAEHTRCESQHDSAHDATPSRRPEWYERLHQMNEIYKQKVQMEATQLEEARLQKRKKGLMTQKSAKLSEARFRAAAGNDWFFI